MKDDSLWYFMGDEPDWYKCANGHMVCAYDIAHKSVNLALHTCPVCLGRIRDPEDAIFFANVLSPIQRGDIP